MQAVCSVNEMANHDHTSHLVLLTYIALYNSVQASFKLYIQSPFHCLSSVIEMWTNSLKKCGVFAIRDSGPPLGHSDYTTLIIFHGLQLHSGKMHNLASATVTLKSSLRLIMSLNISHLRQTVSFCCRCKSSPCDSEPSWVPGCGTDT